MLSTGGIAALSQPHARLPLFLAGGFTFFSLLALVPDPDKAEGLRRACQAAAWSAWFLVLLAAGSAHPPLWRSLRKLAVVSALLAGGFAIGDSWGLLAIETGSSMRPAGLNGDRDLVASFQILLGPWILWAVIEERGRQRALAGAAWLLGGYVLALTQSRAAWLGAAVMGVTAIFMLMTRGRASLAEVGNRRRVALFAVLPLAVAFLFHGTARPTDDSGRGGIGREVESVAARPYDDRPGPLAQTGIAGSLCWLGILAAALIAGCRSFRSQGHPALGFPILLLTSGLSGFATLCALDFPRERPEHMAWYAASLAALFSLAGDGRAAQP